MTNEPNKKANTRRRKIRHLQHTRRRQWWSACFSEKNRRSDSVCMHVCRCCSCCCVTKKIKKDVVTKTLLFSAQHYHENRFAMKPETVSQSKNNNHGDILCAGTGNDHRRTIDKWKKTEVEIGLGSQNTYRMGQQRYGQEYSVRFFWPTLYIVAKNSNLDAKNSNFSTNHNRK